MYRIATWVGGGSHLAHHKVSLGSLHMLHNVVLPLLWSCNTMVLSSSHQSCSSKQETTSSRRVQHKCLSFRQISPSRITLSQDGLLVTSFPTSQASTSSLCRDLTQFYLQSWSKERVMDVLWRDFWSHNLSTWVGFKHPARNRDRQPHSPVLVVCQGVL